MNRSALLIRSVLAAFASALLVQIATATAAPPAEGLAAAVWPMLGASPAHASRSGFRGPDTNQLAWRFDTNATVVGGAAIDVDGTAFFGSSNGRFFAIDQTGAQRWA